MRKYNIFDKQTNNKTATISATKIKFNGAIAVFYIGTVPIAEVDTKKCTFSEMRC